MSLIKMILLRHLKAGSDKEANRRCQPYDWWWLNSITTERWCLCAAL